MSCARRLRPIPPAPVRNTRIDRAFAPAAIGTRRYWAALRALQSCVTGEAALRRVTREVLEDVLAEVAASHPARARTSRALRELGEQLAAQRAGADPPGASSGQR